MQEGWRIEPIEEGGSIKGLKIVGVVYNEMTGKHSHPESAVSDFSIRSLFPDNEYRFESGGEPLSIPDLTYDKFIGFYKQYYHPSNMKLYLYGNIPTGKILSFIQEEFLAQFERKQEFARVSPQKRWRAPRILEKAYPIDRGEKDTAKSYVSLNWLTGSSLDPFLVLSFELLQEILVGNPGSPLRKALQESGLGEDILPSTGLAAFLPDMIFSVGLRGTDRIDARQIDKLVTRVLVGLAKDGIEGSIIDAALNRIEFRNRENNLDGNYRGIRLFNKIIRSWSEGIAPESTLDFDALISKLKMTLAKKRTYPEHLIEKYFLRNPHRSLLTILPDPAIADREKEELERRLSIVAVDKDAIAKVKEANKKLNAFQSTADSVDALRSIPTLRVSDLPTSPPSIPAVEIIEKGSTPLLFHDLFTNGIVYIDFAFDVSGLDPALFSCMTIFGKAVCSSGTRGMPYDLVARELSRLSGGFYVSFDTDYVAGTTTTKSYLIFRLKALESKLDRTLALVISLFKEADFENTDRMKDILFELRNRYKSSILPSGNYYAGVRAGANLALPFLLEERVSGLSQARFLTSLLQDPAKGVKISIEELTRMRRCTLSSSSLYLNVTCDRPLFEKVKDRLLESVSALPVWKQEPAQQPDRKEPDIPKKLEAIVFPTGVCFNAVALRGSPYETDLNAIETVLAHFISTDFLWDYVRQKGGAYGAHASLSGMASAFIFSSYRDPNIVDTLAGFKSSIEYIRNRKETVEEVEKAIIGTVANAEKPMPPGEKGIVSLKRRLYHITDEMRQMRRHVVLGTTIDDLERAAISLLAKFEEGFSVTIASREKIASESSRLPGLMESISDLAI
jgi:Zn-dependent M16 (insulinase) family peptidase